MTSTNPKSHRYAYLHGFGSSERSRKGVALAPIFGAEGIKLHLPNLNNPSFSKLSFTGSLEAMDALDIETGGENAPPWCFIGSSMGGYLAARWAELNPTRVSRLLLLCPGFDLMSRWLEMLGAETIAEWERVGHLPFPDAQGNPCPVWWRFMEDGRNHPTIPEVPVETLIIHGTLDDVVPLASSVRYAKARPHVRLITVEDNHSLTDTIPTIEEQALSFFGISSAH